MKHLKGPAYVCVETGTAFMLPDNSVILTEEDWRKMADEIESLKYDRDLLRDELDAKHARLVGVADKYRALLAAREAK